MYNEGISISPGNPFEILSYLGENDSIIERNSTPRPVSKEAMASNDKHLNVNTSNDKSPLVGKV